MAILSTHLLACCLVVAAAPTLAPMPRYNGHSALEWTAQLLDVDVARRREAIEMLNHFGPEATMAERPLRRLLRTDPSASVRGAAARALVAIAPPGADALTDLQAALRDDTSPFVRADAASALGGLGSAARASADDLAHAAKHDSYRLVRLRAATALQRVRSGTTER